MNTAPTLPAYSDGINILVWCGYCRTYHVHGSGGDGHRVAHCMDDNSPYDRTGYILAYVGPAPKEMIADMDRVKPRGPIGA